MKQITFDPNPIKPPLTIMQKSFIAAVTIVGLVIISFVVYFQSQSNIAHAPPRLPNSSYQDGYDIGYAVTNPRSYDPCQSSIIPIGDNFDIWTQGCLAGQQAKLPYAIPPSG